MAEKGKMGLMRLLCSMGAALHNMALGETA